MGSDVWELVAYVFSTSDINLALADVVIVPTPKIDVPEKLKDF